MMLACIYLNEDLVAVDIAESKKAASYRSTTNRAIVVEDDKMFFYVGAIFLYIAHIPDLD
jgi:hypothetical protein